MASDKTNNLSALVGRNIAQRRKILGITQDDLADRLNITPAALSRIESGRTAPRFSRLSDIAGCLGCPVADLFTSSDSVPVSASFAYIVERVGELPDDIQGDLIHLILELVHTFKRNLDKYR